MSDLKEIKEQDLPVVSKEDAKPLVPEGLKDKIKTTVRNMSDVFNERLEQIKDIASLEVLAPVEARLRNRLKSLKEASQAKNIRIRGHWKTTPPEMHVCNIVGKRINHDEAEITFGIYETDKAGNKVLHAQTIDRRLHNGDVIQDVIGGQYNIEFDVVERIKTGKVIEREVIRTEVIK